MADIVKSALCSAARILVWLVVFAELVGGCAINTLMFHPVKGGYDRTAHGYVDIGTNGVGIAAFVLGPRRGKKAIIRCHGNAEDAFDTLWALEELAAEGYTVASVDYPGYGLSDGSPDEEGCYRVVHRLYDWLVEERGFKPEDIVVDGFSIGTGPAVELAASRPVGGLVLEAPFLSAPRVVTRVRILAVDPFPNLKRIAEVKCPKLFFHGTGDGIIPYAHGKALFDLAGDPKTFVPVEGGDHNDFVLVMGPGEYRRRIVEFLKER
ncbi:MAG: alpha/beta hydrolase [Kiritimatiellia bacterium]